MSYQEALKATITRGEAIRFVREHSSDIAEFFEDVGDKPHYKGAEVLAWLGY